MMTLTEQLLHLSDAYCAAKSLSRSRVSTLIFGDGMRLEGVAAGKDINTRSYERAVAWLSENWPSDAGWPETVKRPLPVEAQS